MPLGPYDYQHGQTVKSNVAGCAALAQAWDVHWSKSPAAASDTAVHAAVTLAVGATTTVTTAITNPDVARNLTVKGNQASVTGNVVITGTDLAGATITETIASSGSSSVAGNKAFATVTQIVVPQQAAGGDTISIGVGSKLGLHHALPHNTVSFAFLNNTREGTAPTVAVSTSALSSNTATLNSSIPGSQVVDIYYKVSS